MGQLVALILSLSAVLHRRSLSEDVSTLTLFAHLTPSEKARHHALRMCKQDPHYRPRTTNPFVAFPRLRGVKKFLGNYSCSELPSTTAEAAESPRSLPGSPTAVRRTPLAKAPHQAGSGSNLSDIVAAEAPIASLRRRGSCESGFYSSVGECLSPSSLWDSGTAVSSLRSLDELEPALYKRASSIYTDSSEDISSLTGSDWTQDLQPNISSIVEYFERKGGGFKHNGGARGSLQLSSRITSLRRSLERQGGAAVAGAPAAPPQRTKCSRLMVCEGAVRSKLPLFDKKVGQ